MTSLSIDPDKVGEKLSLERLSTYLSACSGDWDKALMLYSWNVELSGALFEAIAIVEVVVRNEFDVHLADWSQALGTDWMDGAPLDAKGREDIAKARSRAYKNPTHGQVIAQLSFGFWKFLATKRYLHSIWLPAMHGSFPNLAGLPGDRRISVEQSIDRVWFLRNRIGHHEPIFSRDISRDLQAMSLLLDWICEETSAWASGLRRVDDVLARRPPA